MCTMLRSPEDRFWSYVDKSAGSDGCWLWLGYRTRDGYGKFNANDGTYRNVKAHRYAYEIAVGAIPAGLQVDHVKARGCQHRHCVNPAHLEPVTNRENALRSDSFSGINARRTRCVRGHLFTPENTRIDRLPNQTRRCCRACDAIRQRAYQQRIKARSVS